MASATSPQQSPTPSPSTPVEAPQQDFLLGLLAWVELNRQRLVVGLAGVIALYGVVYLYRHYAAEKELRANAALLDLRQRPGEPNSAPKAADYLKVAEQHAGSSAAPRARLLAAGALFTEGKYAEAQAEFERVLAADRSGQLGAQAAYGLAACLEGQDKLDQALAKFQEVISQYPEESVAGQARLSLARLQEGKQQPAAALRLYDELLKDKEQGAFAQQATRFKDELLKKHPELAGGATGGTNVPGSGK